MGAIASQITSLTIVYSTVYSDADQRKHQSPASLAFAQMASNVDNASIWWRHPLAVYTMVPSMTQCSDHYISNIIIGILSYMPIGYWQGSGLFLHQGQRRIVLRFGLEVAKICFKFIISFWSLLARRLSNFGATKQLKKTYATALKLNDILQHFSYRLVNRSPGRTWLIREVQPWHT